jgi:hypothetical protein
MSNLSTSKVRWGGQLAPHGPRELVRSPEHLKDSGGCSRGKMRPMAVGHEHLTAARALAHSMSEACSPEQAS